MRVSGVGANENEGRTGECVADEDSICVIGDQNYGLWLCRYILLLNERWSQSKYCHIIDHNWQYGCIYDLELNKWNENECCSNVSNDWNVLFFGNDSNNQKLNFRMLIFTLFLLCCLGYWQMSTVTMAQKICNRWLSKRRDVEEGNDSWTLSVMETETYDS